MVLEIDVGVFTAAFEKLIYNSTLLVVLAMQIFRSHRM